jgi:general secretion pathway protein E
LKAGKKIWRPVGCPSCHGDGYRGRAGLYEVIAVDEQFQALVHEGASEAQLERVARKYGPSLLEDGVRKVRDGLTTVEEVARVVRDEA